MARMIHTDETGHRAPAGSAIAKRFRAQKEQVAAEGRKYHAARIARERKFNKPARLKVIARGQKSQIRRDETKGKTEYHGGLKGQRAYKKVHEERY